MPKLNRQEIVAKYLRGISVSKIAKEYGVSNERIYQLLRKEPLYEVWKRTHYCAKHKETIDAVIECRTPRELAKRLGISRPNVYALLKRLVKYGCIDPEVARQYYRGENTLTSKIIKMILAGYRNVEIAKELGVDQRYVSLIKWKWMKKQRAKMNEGKDANR